MAKFFVLELTVSENFCIESSFTASLISHFVSCEGLLLSCILNTLFHSLEAVRRGACRLFC